MINRFISVSYTFYFYESYYHFTLSRVFNTSISRWFLAGASLFWPILILLSFGWYPLVLLFPSPPDPLIILWWLPSATITIGITVTFMLLSRFRSLARSWYLSLFSLSFNFICGLPGWQSLLFGMFSFFFFFFFVVVVVVDYYKIRSSGQDLVTICISKSQRTLCVSFSRSDSGLCVFHLFISSNLNFSYNSQLITFPAELCRVFYSFCANLLYLLVMRLIVSSLSPHNLHLLFCCVLSNLAMT